jgi:hypothetical protein
MAATVLNGTGNLTWTNTTGSIARVIINYFGSNDVGPGNSAGATNGNGITIYIGTMAVSANYATAIGKNLAINLGGSSSTLSSFFSSSNNMVVMNDLTAEQTQQALPIEFYVPISQTFGITLSGGTAQYNIIIIPEAG